MSFRMDMLALLIYLAMAIYLLAFVVTLAKFPKAGWILYAGGFALSCATVSLRAWEVGHAPLQNLFEVFLVLAGLMFPLSLLCRRTWNVTGHCWDILIAVVILFPAGFVFSAVPRKLPAALQSPLFIPHVMSYMLAYVLLTKAAIQSMRQLAYGSRPEAADCELAAYRIARPGVALLTGGLILGAWWGKLAWGDYWNWDPKEMWSLATWLIYIAFFHFRLLNGRRMAKANAAFLLAGAAAVITTLLIVSLASVFTGQHSYAT